LEAHKYLEKIYKDQPCIISGYGQKLISAECMPSKELNKSVIKMSFHFNEYSNKLISHIRGSAVSSQLLILGNETKMFVFTSVHNGSLAHPFS
jgi:hypothetical protein